MILKKNINKNIKVIQYDRKLNLDNYERFAFIINEGCLKNEDIVLINENNELYKDKLVGWFYLDSKIKL